MSIPNTPEGWERAFYLPGGVVEAVRIQPATARLCEIIAHVRDQSLRDRGMPPVGSDEDRDRFPELYGGE